MGKQTYQQRSNQDTKIPVSQRRTEGGKVLEDNRAAFKARPSLGAIKRANPLTDQQPQLTAMTHSSSTMAAQHNIVESVSNSPYVTAQRQRLNNLTSSSTWQLKEDPLSEKTQSIQRVEAAAPPNNTGLPDHLKSGIESLSGLSMDNVKVHYNSAKPAQLNALAYAQGTDIHVGPGQEKHLPHEAWHVVQQAQGRVKPTMQMKEGVPVNDDKSLEHEADTMGRKAVQMSQSPHVTGPESVSSVGLSFQNKALATQHNQSSLATYNTQEPAVQCKVGFEIEVLGMRIEEPEQDDFEDEDQLPAIAPRRLTKGEILHQGGGWKLTPDGKIGNEWTPEYVVAAVDETTGSDTLIDRVAQVAAHAQDNLADPSTWTNGAQLETWEDGEDILGNFHITGGLRLSRISELIKVLYNGQDAGDATTDKALATRAEGIGWSGRNYKSVVALVALQIKDLTTGPLPGDGTSAKLGVSLLSRTDLGVVVGKVTKFSTRDGFINDVLTTSGVAGDTKLFRHQLPGADDSGRTIDDQQDLTARQWINHLLDGHDYVWSETQNDAGQNFGMEKVGPSTLGHRAEGVILELRGGIIEQGNYSPRAKDWTEAALKYARLFRMLNAKEDSASILRAFNGEQ